MFLQNVDTFNHCTVQNTREENHLNNFHAMSAETFQAVTFSVINRMNVAIKPNISLFIANRLSYVTAKTSDECKQILASNVISSLSLKVCTLLIICRFMTK